MITFVILLILAVTWIWGVRCVFSEGYVFERAGLWWESKVPAWIYKPTIGCSACMASVHGSLWFWTWGKVFLPDVGVIMALIIWAMFCICLCGINYILLEIIYAD
jgi:hypothetical protein